MSIFKPGCQKTGPFNQSYINDEKLCQSYTFSYKKGAYHIPVSAEKDSYLARTPVHVIYRYLPPSPSG